MLFSVFFLAFFHFCFCQDFAKVESVKFSLTLEKDSATFLIPREHFIGKEQQFCTFIINPTPYNSANLENITLEIQENEEVGKIENWKTIFTNQPKKGRKFINGEFSHEFITKSTIENLYKIVLSQKKTYSNDPITVDGWIIFSPKTYFKYKSEDITVDLQYSHKTHFFGIPGGVQHAIISWTDQQDKRCGISFYLDYVKIHEQFPVYKNYEHFSSWNSYKNEILYFLLFNAEYIHPKNITVKFNMILTFGEPDIDVNDKIQYIDLTIPYIYPTAVNDYYSIPIKSTTSSIFFNFLGTKFDYGNAKVQIVQNDVVMYETALGIWLNSYFNVDLDPSLSYRLRIVNVFIHEIDVKGYIVLFHDNPDSLMYSFHYNNVKMNWNESLEIGLMESTNKIDIENYSTNKATEILLYGEDEQTIYNKVYKAGKYDQITIDTYQKKPWAFLILNEAKAGLVYSGRIDIYLSPDFHNNNLPVWAIVVIVICAVMVAISCVAVFVSFVVYIAVAMKRRKESGTTPYTQIK